MADAPHAAPTPSSSTGNGASNDAASATPAADIPLDVQRAMALAAATSSNLVRPDSRLLRHRPSKVTVLGSGSYGTAMACHLARLGHEVWLLTRRDEVAKAVTATHKNPSCSFPDVQLPYNITATTSAGDALRGTTLVVHAIPVQSSYGYLRALRTVVPPGVTIVNTSKGVYSHREAAAAAATPLSAAAATPAGLGGSGGSDVDIHRLAQSALRSSGSSGGSSDDVTAAGCSGCEGPASSSCAPLADGEIAFMARLIPAALGRPQPCAMLSGPTFAAEVVAGFPTGAVVAAEDAAVAAAVKAAFEGHTFRIWTSSDVVGVEVAGALKNVYALAAGCVEGLGLGMNTTAMLCTRAVSEMNGLARSLGSTEATLAGLSGVGDLMLTCFGKASRNRSVGVRLGKGESLASILASMSEVAEGVATAPVALRLAQARGVSVPIIEAIVATLEGKIAPLSALMALLTVPTGDERVLT